MEVLFKFILFYLCFQLAVSAKLTYKTAVLSGDLRNGVKDYVSQMNEISKRNADILLLSSDIYGSDSFEMASCTDNYDDLVRDISGVAKNFNVYVAIHLYQRVQCQDGEEIVRNNLVLDKEGAVVAVYTKPLNIYASCNVTSQKTTFTTDFGVEFLTLMEDDVLLQDLGSLKNVKNIIVTGGTADSEIYLRGNQLISSWAYDSNANVISNHGIFIGKAGLKTKDNSVVEINKNGEDKFTKLSFNPINLRDLPIEDTDQHIIRPLDLEASTEGYRETVCDGGFCCEFYVRTGSLDAKANDAHYGLSVYSGVRRMGLHNIGVDSCKLVVCAALYKRTCVLGLDNNMNVTFEKISIKGNFTTHHSLQLPVILTTEMSMSYDNFDFVEKSTSDIQEVSIELSNASNILKFGIFSRDYTRDYDDHNFNFINTTKSHGTNDFYEYILSENVVELFDYLWIKVRVLIFIVSIYVLEMM